MSTILVNTLTGTSTAGSIAVTGEGNSTTTNLQQGLAKSWVNFNGTSTIAARDSFNHSSLTDNATGDYTTTITNAMGNANYSITSTSSRFCSIIADATGFSRTDPTTTAVRTIYAASDMSLSDGHYICVEFTGDLA
tara:strand:- start:3 stop:410 length:408 start_codon:yes stop_codon:yes gene_type:complete